ncbi:MAG: hydrogenase, partial [Thermoplasmata archaeon]
YLEVENAIVNAAALFVVAYPLLIEAVVLLDVLGVVLISIILSLERTLLGRSDAEWLEELTG